MPDARLYITDGPISEIDPAFEPAISHSQRSIRFLIYDRKESDTFAAQGPGYRDRHNRADFIDPICDSI